MIQYIPLLPSPSIFMHRRLPACFTCLESFKTCQSLNPSKLEAPDARIGDGVHDRRTWGKENSKWAQGKHGKTWIMNRKEVVHHAGSQPLQMFSQLDLRSEQVEEEHFSQQFCTRSQCSMRHVPKIEVTVPMWIADRTRSTTTWFPIHDNIICCLSHSRTKGLLESKQFQRGMNNNILDLYLVPHRNRKETAKLLPNPPKGKEWKRTLWGEYILRWY